MVLFLILFKCQIENVRKILVFIIQVSILRGVAAKQGQVLDLTRYLTTQ